MAYNYCYSTCLGRIVHHLEEQIKKEANGHYDQTLRFGCTDLQARVLISVLLTAYFSQLACHQYL
jgi:hypothetical protein